MVKAKKIPDPPTVEEIIVLLSKDGDIREKVCVKLNEGLEANKPVVADGEIISY